MLIVMCIAIADGKEKKTWTEKKFMKFNLKQSTDPNGNVYLK